MIGRKIYMDKINEVGTVISEVNDNYGITYRVQPDKSNIIYRLDLKDLRDPSMFLDYKKKLEELWEKS